MTIDTLEYVKKLEAAGLDRKLAKAHAEALREAATENLVTKLDYLDSAIARLEMTLIKYRWHRRS